MNTSRTLHIGRIDSVVRRRLRALGLGLALSMAVVAPARAAVDIANAPLFTTSNVPGNLLFVPSVEWPTITSVASLGDYDVSRIYIGYFSAGKCYQYSYSATEANRHFYPVRNTADRTCTGANEWSGNFLNWAATQTIDPFRMVLTGGYRVRDTPTETWLEKANHTGQGGTGIYPNRRIPASGNNSTMLQGATPFSHNWMRMRIQGLGNKMRFRLNDDDVDASVTAYNPGAAVLTTRAYEVSIRVKVCDSAASGGVESNCRPYSQGWKPEGTIQQYWRNLRYGVFGYLNEGQTSRDGGVLRSRIKTVGPVIPGGVVEANNPNKEWDPVTGVLVRNPNPADATDTSSAHGISILDSGVINYLNKFGQMTSQNHKSYDPVSELYYAAIRYLKNQGNVAEYTNMTGTAVDRSNMADGFPVITNWGDPIQAWCQPNVILGIGDIYTWTDKNLPGNGVMTNEPATPGAVSSDATVNVVTRTQDVATIEGIAINTPFTGRDNSAYMAGLAYDAHTRDIRPDLTGGKTTVSTYWVDVLEAQSLEGMERNQFALAAKYGGFRVPDGFDPDTHAGPLPDAWWHSNGETLTPFGSRGAGQAAFLRPDNFFTAGEADAMVLGLTQAFESIINEVESSSTSAATSAAILQTNTLLFVAGFRSGDWTGMLTANDIDQSSGALTGVAWDAEAVLRVRLPSSRNFYTRASDTGSGTLSGIALNPTTDWLSLSNAQRDALNRRPDGTIDGLGQSRINWLRGVEGGDPSFRSRTDSVTSEVRLLGDIVNSNPQFAGKRDFGYSLLSGLGASYTTFRTTPGSDYQNRPDVIYVGANDGLLHAFRSTDGTEIFAYMPSELLLPESGNTSARITTLMSTNYSHRYFMDGTVAVGDAHAASWVGGTSGWKTVLVGSMGSGGRTVFALDVTAPQNFGTGSVLWEFKDPDLGYGVGQPTIARMRNGEWAAVFGNGYNSDNHRAMLFIVRLSDGQLLAKIDTGVGDAVTSNGLATPKVTDWPGLDLSARYIYAGDLQGNMWRFDVSSIDPNQWDSAANRGVLFQALDSGGVPQSITARPEVALNPNDPNSLMVLFGTGSYFRNLDGGNNQVQSLYGIIDANGVAVTGRNQLVQQTITYQGIQTFGTETHTVREMSANAIGADKGWYLDLIYAGNAMGERVISSPTFPSGQIQDRIRFSTLIPDPDPCGTGRTGFIMDIMLGSGGQASFPVFDLNNDGQFDAGDTSSGTNYGGFGGGGGEQIIDIRDRNQNVDHLYGGQDRLGAGRNNAGPANRQSWRQLR